jgi:hypothetical protein
VQPLEKGSRHLRYFFHLVGHSETICDEDGLELPDPEEARLAALSAIEAVQREDPDAVEDWRGWRLNVVEASGALVFSIALDARSVGFLVAACLQSFARSRIEQRIASRRAGAHASNVLPAPSLTS